MTSDADRDVETPAPVGFAQHDHKTCVDSAIAAAERCCVSRHLRFTPVRRAVLEILLREHRALGAYAIMDRLREAGFGSQPPVAYRALDFLVAQGFAHRIEGLNAFIACAHPGENHSPAFMICRVCAAVAEAEAEPSRGSLGTAARAAGFQIERAVVEVEGVCPACAKKADS